MLLKIWNKTSHKNCSIRSMEETSAEIQLHELFFIYIFSWLKKLFTEIWKKLQSFSHLYPAT